MVVVQSHRQGSASRRGDGGHSGTSLGFARAVMPWEGSWGATRESTADPLSQGIMG